MNRKSGNNTPAIGELNWTARAKCSCPPHKSFASLRVDEQVTRVRLLMVCVAIGKTGYESDPKTNELEQDKGSRFIDAYLVVEREKKYREDVCVFYGRIEVAYDGRVRCVGGTTRLSNFFLIIFDWVIFHRKNKKKNAILLTYLLLFSAVYVDVHVLSNSLSISFGNLDVNNELSILDSMIPGKWVDLVIPFGFFSSLSLTLFGVFYSQRKVETTKSTEIRLSVYHVAVTFICVHKVTSWLRDCLCARVQRINNLFTWCNRPIGKLISKEFFIYEKYLSANGRRLTFWRIP